MRFRADLHIHSVLSPCGSLEMSPSSIVRKALVEGLDVIAVADHNSVENCFYTASVAKGEKVTVIYGIEVQTVEEVHLLCYFDREKQLEKFYLHIYKALPDMENNPDFFGDQVVVDENDNIVRMENRLLLNSINLSVEEVMELAVSNGGIVVPAHVESDKFGLMMNLGFIPACFMNGLFELSYNSEPDDSSAKYPQLEGRRFITGSDAHYLKDIGRGWFEAVLPEFSVADLRDAEAYRLQRRIRI